MIKFPKGMVCSKEVHDQWPELEKRMMPLIVGKARTVNRWLGMTYVDLDDAIQEGRLTLLRALISYEKDRGSTLEAYVSKMLQNVYYGLIREQIAKKRIPRTHVLDEHGKYKEIFCPPMPFAEGLVLLSTGENPETKVTSNELEKQVEEFKVRLQSELKGRNKEVFECLVNPPVSFLEKVRELGGDISAPRKVHIAEHLGVNKNKVDWSIKRIRQMFTKMARVEEFGELFGHYIDCGEWPEVFVSDKKYDTTFVQEIIEKRNLNPVPLEGGKNYQESGCFARQIEKYPWGFVLVLKHNIDWCTLVIEGRFNANTGEVVSKKGMREKIPVAWYPKLVQAMRIAV